MLQPALLLPTPHPTSAFPSYPDAAPIFSLIKELVHAIRTIRADMKLPPSAATDIHLEGNTCSIERHVAIITALVPTQTLTLNTPQEHSFASSSFVKEIKVTIPLPKEFLEKEKKRLEKKHEVYKKQIDSLEKQLSLPHFIERAPQELVQKTRVSLAEMQGKLKSSIKILSQLTKHDHRHNPHEK